MKKPLVSVIIATFNSSKTLPLVLESVRKQKFKKEKLEILIVDGGSTDDTLSIASKFRCRIINNPKTEPVYAKVLAFNKARGRYHIYLDHDEEILNNNSIRKKLKAVKENTEVKAVAGSGYVSPKGYPFVNKYINEFGDPFSFFIYRLTKDSKLFINSMKKDHKAIKDDKDYIVFDLSKAELIPIIELVAGGTLIDAEFFKREYKQLTKSIFFMGQSFNLMYLKFPYIAITKDDDIMHHSSDTTKGYLSKIKWRVKNNIYFSKETGKAGFLGRDEYQSRIVRMKKYLYLPYVFSIFPLLFDCVWLIKTRKDFAYIIHFPLSLYTAFLIVFYYLLNAAGVKQKLKSYDETIEIG